MLVAVSVLLAVALAALWFSPVAPWRVWSPPQPQAPNLDDARAALLGPNLAAAATYPVVLARPLFQPTRRPPEPEATGAPAAPAAIEQIKLLGLVSGTTLTGVLIEEQGARRFVRSDEQVGDWKLQAIEGRYAVFARGSERKQIELPRAYLNQGSQGGAAAAAPAARNLTAASLAGGARAPGAASSPPNLANNQRPWSAPSAAASQAAPAPAPRATPTPARPPVAVSSSVLSAAFGGGESSEPPPRKEEGRAR
jgi:hypothetical protein